MSISDLFNHSCSIYHLQKTTTSPGFGLPGTTSYSYPSTPDVSGVPCHFKINARAEMVQQEPMNTYLYTGKLSLPEGTDIRLHDKIINEESGLEFIAQVPESIRGHHMIVMIQRKGSIAAL